MSEVQTAKPNAIQIVEQELATYVKQRETAISNLHAVDGAIQAANRVLQLLRIEAAKVEAEAKKLLADAQTEAKKLADDAETEVGKVVEFVKEKLKD